MTPQHTPKSFTARTLLACAIASTLLLAATPASAKEGNAGKDDAVATVKKGVIFIKSNGREKGYAEISNKQGAFNDVTSTWWSTAWTARCAPTAPTRRWLART